MPRGNGFTRRGIFGAGAAGAVAAGLSACGDDYFEPATSHGKDVAERRPDLHGLDARGLHRPLQQALRLRQPARRHAEHRRARQGLARLQDGRPGGDAHRPGAPRRSSPACARSRSATTCRRRACRSGPGWISIQDNQPIVTEVLGEAGIETAYCTDNPFLIGPRFANFRRTVDFVKPSFSQGAYRFLNKPFKRPAPRSAIERYLLPELSDSVEVGRLRSMVGWNSIYRDTDADYPTARVFRSAHQPRRRPEEEAPVLPRRRRVRPARAARRPEDLPGQVRRAQGDRDDEGHHADPAVRDALLVGDRHEARPRDDRARARAVRGRDRVHRRVDRPADEQAGRPEPARRDGRHLLRPTTGSRSASRASSASTAPARSGTSTTCRS